MDVRILCCPEYNLINRQYKLFMESELVKCGIVSVDTIKQAYDILSPIIKNCKPTTMFILARMTFPIERFTAMSNDYEEYKVMAMAGSNMIFREFIGVPRGVRIGYYKDTGYTIAINLVRHKIDGTKLPMHVKGCQIRLDTNTAGGGSAVVPRMIKQQGDKHQSDKRQSDKRQSDEQQSDEQHHDKQSQSDERKRDEKQRQDEEWQRDQDEYKRRYERWQKDKQDYDRDQTAAEVEYEPTNRKQNDKLALVYDLNRGYVSSQPTFHCLIALLAMTVLRLKLLRWCQ